MKKYSVIFILLAFIMAIAYFNSFSFAKTYADSKMLLDKREQAYHCSSKSAYLMDYQTKTIIYSKNELQQLPIASMCKIMTLLLCFEAIDNNEIKFDDIVIVSENSSNMGGSQVFLETNGEYSVGELIKSIVVASANDACVAMAEKLCGSEMDFVDKMNEKAGELGMKNTVFSNCTGLPSAEQHSCAKDVATMFCELLKHDDYFRFSKIWTDVVSHPNDRKTEISNTNKLIRFYQGCDSGKTGYTSEAGHCLAASAKRNDMRLVGVVICAPNSKERFKDVSEMFNFGFTKYVNKLIVDKEKPLNLEVTIKGGKTEKIEVVSDRSVYVFGEKNQKHSIEYLFERNDKLVAPVNMGDKLGVLHIFNEGKEIDCVNVLANENIARKSYFDILGDIGENWAII